MLNGKAIRARLVGKITEAYGDIKPKTLRSIAAIAGVSETTLGRFVAPERYRHGRTNTPREATLKAVAVALDLNYGWLRDGVGSEQLGVWPVLVRQTAEVEVGSPVEELRAAIEALAGLPENAVRPACRAAVSGMVNGLVGAGAMVPPDLYRSLIRLDALQRREGLAS